MFCSKCGKENLDDAKFCASCGTLFTDTPNTQSAPSPQSSAPPSMAAPGVPAATSVSPKSKITAALLAFFLGQLGIHRFYTGHIGTGIVILILTIVGYATSWVFGLGFIFLVAVGIWVLIDFIMILMGKFKDKDGLYITK